MKMGDMLKMKALLPTATKALKMILQADAKYKTGQIESAEYAAIVSANVANMKACCRQNGINLEQVLEDL